MKQLAKLNEICYEAVVEQVRKGQETSEILMGPVRRDRLIGPNADIPGVYRTQRVHL